MTTPAVAPVLRMLLAQTKCEVLMRWRVPAFSVTNLILPIVFFIFFGLPVANLRSADGVSIGAYLLASFGAYAVGNVMVYGFGIGVANERGMKVDRLMRASPLPPLVFMLAKVVTALAFAFLALVLLIGFGIVAGGQKLAGLVAEILQDRARFHQRQAVVAVDDRRDAVVRADLEEFRLELLVLADVDGMRGVRQPQLLQQNGSLAAVGGGPGVEIDHGLPSCV